MKKVLVAGATGYLGGHIVKELKKRGYWVRVLIRKVDQAEQFEDVDDVFVGQITDATSLKGVAQGIDWVFTSVGITRQKDGMTYMDVDFQGNLNLLKEAEKAAVSSFTYVSVLGAEKVPHLKIIQAKEKFVNALKASALKSCIIRPSGFFSDLRELLEMAKKKKIYLIGDGENKVNPISGVDLAIVCIDSMEKSISEINVGGPKTYSQNQIAKIAFDALKIKARIIHLPIWIRNVVVFFLRTFTSPKFYGPYEFFLTALTLDASTDEYGKDFLEDFYEAEALKM